MSTVIEDGREVNRVDLNALRKKITEITGNDDDARFTSELSALINRESREGKSDTPDFIIAEFLVSCLSAYEKTVVRTNEWYGKSG